MKNMHNCVRKMKKGTLETESTGIMMRKRDDGWDEVTDGRSVSKHNVKSYDSRNPKKARARGEREQQPIIAIEEIIRERKIGLHSSKTRGWGGGVCSIE